MQLGRGWVEPPTIKMSRNKTEGEATMALELDPETTMYARALSSLTLRTPPRFGSGTKPCRTVCEVGRTNVIPHIHVLIRSVTSARRS